MWLLLALIITAVTEYIGHRWLHHKSSGALWRDHVVRHHGQHSVEVNIDLPIWHNLLSATPWVIISVSLGLWELTFWLYVCAIVHAIMWTQLHRSFHDVKHSWIVKMPGYWMLRRHHLHHHDVATKNYGVVFGPLMDKICGTWSKP